ncbi:hypothetical protein ACFL5X_01655 [Candidatus Omnitrophota bacterium]
MLEQKQLERLCIRCGACCGAYDGDPCLYLKKHKKGYYHCEIYATRLGTRITVSGEDFDCVPIARILKSSWIGDWRCSYKRRLQRF